MFSARLLAAAFGIASAGWVAHGAEVDLAPYSQVEVAPVSTWAYLANITLTVDRFRRQDSTYTSSYTANILPFFLLNEKGTLRINVADGALEQLARGNAIDFTGSAARDSDGKERRVEGRATPVGAANGTLKVRLFYSRRIVLVFTTVYHLPGLSPVAKITPPPRP